MTDELKPCPFCGGTDLEWVAEAADALEATNTRIALLEQTLREIANADTAEWDDPGEFEWWAKGRARGALGLAGKEGP